MNPKSRKEEYAEITRQALLDSALELFIQKGFSKTSIEDIVLQARVTRGALYHHFKSKEEIFIKLYKGLVEQLVTVIETAIKDIDDPWEKASGGCRAFLNYCINPDYQSIRLDDAIGVLGWARWRKIDSAYTMKVLKNILEELNDAGELTTGSVDIAANMIYALLVEAALNIAAAKDKAKAHDDAIEIIQNMLTGLKR